MASADVLAPGWWNATSDDMDAARNRIVEVVDNSSIPLESKNPDVILLAGWQNHSVQELTNAIDQLDGEIARRNKYPVPTYTPVPTNVESYDLLDIPGVDPVMFDAHFWYDATSDVVESYLLNTGYEQEPNGSVQIGTIKAVTYMNKDKQPSRIVFNYQTTNRKLSIVNVSFSNSKQLFDNLTDYLSSFCGEPVFIPQKKETIAKNMVYTEAARLEWVWGGYKFSLAGDIDMEWDRVRAGNGALSLIITEFVPEVTTPTPQPTAIPTPSPTPKPTIKPTEKPTPVPIVQDISCINGYFKTTKRGIKLYAQFANQAEDPVTEIAFRVRCLDSSGKALIIDGKINFGIRYYKKTLKANRSTPKDTYWSIECDKGTERVEIAVISYRFKNGKNVEIRSAQWKWIPIEKK